MKEKHCAIFCNWIENAINRSTFFLAMVQEDEKSGTIWVRLSQNFQTADFYYAYPMQMTKDNAKIIAAMAAGQFVQWLIMTKEGEL